MTQAPATLGRNDDGGFTLIELLVVLVIVGILIAIAVPSYLGFSDRASSRSAQANVRSAATAAEAYYVDNGYYTGMDVAALRAIDAGMAGGVSVISAGASQYCLTATLYGKDAYFRGPGGVATSAACT